MSESQAQSERLDLEIKLTVELDAQLPDWMEDEESLGHWTSWLDRAARQLYFEYGSAVAERLLAEEVARNILVRRGGSY